MRAETGAPAKFVEYAKSYKGDDCLLWPYANATRPVFWRDGKNVLVCRELCAHQFGPPPRGYHAAHDCGMGHIGCVNPRHLRWKSPKANQADRIVHGTYIEGERHHAAKLTEALAEEIIHLVASGSSQRELSKVFGISNQSINDLVKGKTWACVHNRLAGTGAAQVGATSGQS